MIQTSQSLKIRIREYARSTGLNHQQVYQNFMFERFLERLSYSIYKESFIIKGGCLLSSIMGIDMRATMDIDANIINIPFNKESIENIMKSIIEIDICDSINFAIRDIKEIKELKEYKGLRFFLIASISNLRISFHVDISTGDIITPRAISYQYKKLFDDSSIDLMVYNNETIIAEKLQTILELKLRNSRMKDYYDIYCLVSAKWEQIDKIILAEAVNVTFKSRNSLDDLNNIEMLLKVFENDEILNKFWQKYQENHSYANGIAFKDTINAINKIILSLNMKQTIR